jgi:prepilin-type N-terminal cleavage/methylation domain-containing protein
MKQRSPGRPGFTMVELLTVIAIIAILAAIIFPVFSTVRKNVYKAQCTSNLHSLAQALKLYKDDWKVYPNALFGYFNPDARPEPTVQTFLYPQYIRERNVFKCPLSPERTTEMESRLLLKTAHPITGTDPVSGRAWSFQYFAWDSYDGSIVPHPNGVYQLHYVRKWSEQRIGFNDDPRQLIYRNPPDSTVVTWCTYHRDYSAGQPAQGSIDLVLFLDGHVKPTPTTEMLPIAGQPARAYQAKK